MGNVIEQCIKLKQKNRKLRKQVKELKAELKHCSKAYQEMGDMWAQACDERDELADVLHGLQKDTTP